jgi:Tfp pilus assembly protein PilE
MKVMRRIAKDEGGQGLMELVIAIAVINVAILAMFAMFQAGALSILRASRTSNGAVLAEKQAELYRAMLYKDIQLNDGLVTSAASDTLHIAASEWGSSTAQVQASTCTNTLPECMPIQSSVTGADGRAYRVDTYIQAVTPSSGRAGKQVTVVVRLASDTSRVLAKLTANYDLATGCTTSTAAAAAAQCT